MRHILKAGVRQIDLSTPVCMAILNITPDSFSDGAELGAITAGRFRVDLDRVLARAEAMLAEGVSFLDVGGESTRPGASSVSVQEEMDRVLPVVEALAERLDVCISLDSSAAEVIQAAIDAGAGLVNDIRALSRPGAMAAVARSEAAVCLMHMRGEPQTMQQDPHYDDVVAEVSGFLEERLAACAEAGIARDRCLVDPGFGFGKSPEHNYQLLNKLDHLDRLGAPVLVGLSRKSMIGKVTSRPVDDRVPGSTAAATLALSRGARVLRSHDASATMDAIRIFNAFNEAGEHSGNS